MALELALVQPPNMYDVSPPATYEMAGEMLYSTGKILLDVIDGQPAQQTYAQTLTAQTLRELGRGWTSVFSIMPSDPSNPEPGHARFQWSPGAELVLAFPDYDIGQEACDAMEGFYRAAVWRDVMRQGSGMQLPHLLGQFEALYSQALDGGATQRMAEAVGEMVTELYAMLFQFEATGGPLMTELKIQWGGAGECLPTLAQEYRASRS